MSRFWLWWRDDILLFAKLISHSSFSNLCASNIKRNCVVCVLLDYNSICLFFIPLKSLRLGAVHLVNFQHGRIETTSRLSLSLPGVRYPSRCWISRTFLRLLVWPFDMIWGPNVPSEHTVELHVSLLRLLWYLKVNAQKFFFYFVKARFLWILNAKSKVIFFVYINI